MSISHGIADHGDEQVFRAGPLDLEHVRRRQEQHIADAADPALAVHHLAADQVGDHELTLVEGAERVAGDADDLAAETAGGLAVAHARDRQDRMRRRALDVEHLESRSPISSRRPGTKTGTVGRVGDGAGATGPMGAADPPHLTGSVDDLDEDALSFLRPIRLHDGAQRLAVRPLRPITLPRSGSATDSSRTTVSSSSSSSYSWTSTWSGSSTRVLARNSSRSFRR